MYRAVIDAPSDVRFEVPAETIIRDDRHDLIVPLAEAAKGSQAMDNRAATAVLLVRRQWTS
jgi:hypothetical protein